MTLLTSKIILILKDSDLDEYKRPRPGEFVSWTEVPVAALQAPDVAVLARELLRLLFPGRNYEELEQKIPEAKVPLKVSLVYRFCLQLGGFEGWR
jgi:hypothetical protein